MLSYAFTTLNQSNYENVSAEEFDNIHNLFAAILAKGIGQQLKQGLYREYINRIEDLTTMRGKIDLPGTIKNQMGRKLLLSCDYDELSENNIYNQILKSTVLVLLRNAKVDDEYKSNLKKEMLFFSAVDEVDLSAVHWSSIRFQRNNQTYRMLISICQLISQGMLLTTSKGEIKLATFIDEQRMCRLYEKFILEFYKKECPKIKASADQIPWSLDDENSTMLPVMQSDITLSLGGKILIIDAKYYNRTMQTQFDTNTVHSNNLYQIFTYVKNKEAELAKSKKEHEVSGMLLYAKTDEQIQPNNVYKMSGNKISVRTLDLNNDFSVIAKNLHLIVEEHFG